MSSAKRLLLTAIALMVVVAVGAGGYLVGLLMSDPESEALASADDSVFALVPIQERIIQEGVSLAGEAVPGGLVTLPYYLPEGTQRAVVTQVLVSEGQNVNSGDHLATISGRPVFALEMNPPPYRELQRDSEGLDVLALKTSLAELGFSVTDGNRFDWSTEVALRDFYAERGQAAPGGNMPRFVLSEFLVFESGAPVVLGVPKLGAVLAADVGVMSLQVSPSTLKVRADLIEADYFPLGGAVQVMDASGEELTGEVVEISTFQQAGDGKPPGQDVTIRILEGSAGVVAGQPYTISVQSAQDKGPAVPIAAIRQEAGRTYILIDGLTAPERFDVRVISEGNGWARIETVDPLPPDSLVVVE